MENTKMDQDQMEKDDTVVIHEAKWDVNYHLSDNCLVVGPCAEKITEHNIRIFETLLELPLVGLQDPNAQETTDNGLITKKEGLDS